MRVKYPLNNLERKIDLSIKDDAINYYRMSYIGYLIVYGDFTIEPIEPIAHLSDTVPDAGQYHNKSMRFTTGSKDEEFIEWTKIGTDFCLSYIKKYGELFATLQEGYLGNSALAEKNIIEEYIIDNKDEFPDAYLEMML